MQNHSNEAVGCNEAMESMISRKCDKAEYEFAGFWVRLAAYAIDMAIVTAGLLVVRLLFLGVNSLISGTFLEGGILFHYTIKDIVLYFLQVVYFILFTYHTGTTLGKKALNLRVIRANGEDNLSLLTVIYRETIGRFLCGFILCIGYIIAGLDKEKRGLHDILCDTRVIYAKKVKVYPVYPKTYAGQARESGNDGKSEVKTSNREKTAQDDIAEQWNQILNTQKEEITPPSEEHKI